MTDVALRFEAVGFSYTDTPILRAIDLSCEPGRMVSILGVNGAGKSTLLRCAAGLAAPTSGTIRLFGEDIYRMTTRERARVVGFVPQRLAIHTDPTVRELVFLGRMPHVSRFDFRAVSDQEKTGEILAKTGLASLAERRVSTISGGELQRALIAMSLVGERKILLLDEPTTHLDIKHRIEITRMLRDLTRDLGITVIAAIHDMDIVSSFYDRVVVIKDGVIWGDGDPRSIISPRLFAEVFGVAYPDDWPSERP